jgi:hypothetical protein
MSEKLYLIVVDWEISGSILSVRNKLQSCQYVSLQRLTPIDQQFFEDHELWRTVTHGVTATETDILLFQLDSRFKDYKVFPHPGGDPTDE